MCKGSLEREIGTEEEPNMIERLPQSSGKVLGFKMSGRLHDEDYQKFVPVIDAAVAKEGKIRLWNDDHHVQE